MIDNATRVRRLRSVLITLVKLDVHEISSGKKVCEELKVLKERASSALRDTNLGRGNSPHLRLARNKARIKNRQIGGITEARVRPILKLLRAEGFNTYDALGVELLKRGIRPPRAKKWGKSSLRNIELRHTQK